MAMPPPVDLVLTFKGSHHSLSKQEAIEDSQSAEAEYSRLLKVLSDAGLRATGRRGGKQGQILVIVWTPPRRIAQLVEKQRHADFLLGLPSSTLPGHTRDFTESPLSHADRLRIVYSYVTSLKSEGGLGIIPGVQEWPRVDSILAIHDHAFNQSWITTWTRRRLGFNVGADQLNKIRDEFGEAVALYFAFLSSYTQALFFPSAIGILFWALSSPYSPWYSAILTIWSIWWVEWWRIREKVLSVRWGTLGSFRAEKRRPEFRGQEGKSAEGRLETTFPWWKRELRMATSLPIILFFAAILAALLTAIFVFEAFVTRFYQGPLHQYISLAPTVLFVALVPRVLELYQALACRLTLWENHSHQSSHDASLTIKTFALSAIVAYLGLALSAFIYVPFGELVMGSVQTYVTNATSTEGGEKNFFVSNASTQAGLDPSRLQNQMFAYTVTNQIINTLIEVVLPYLMRGVDDMKNGKALDGLRGNKKKVEFEDERIEDKVERQFLEEIRHNVSLPQYSLFGDYSEMITQFGYVALWSTIWPLAPVMALLNNWLELRSDAFKIATHNRRPLPVRVDTIGPWLESMASISWLGALTNSALVYLFHPDSIGAFSASLGTALNADKQLGLSAAWQQLMVPALLIALSSSHGYLLARSLVRHLMVRALWKGSDEERALQRAQEEVKRFYLKKAEESEEELSDVAVAQLTQGSQDLGQDKFWDVDEGKEELRRASKTA
ncbi:DUF590-domain-containing protein [Ramaria rubella]|nr:DUF590-domain-containing protein [Ramaria rubella]